MGYKCPLRTGSGGTHKPDLEGQERQDDHWIPAAAFCTGLSQGRKGTAFTQQLCSLTSPEHTDHTTTESPRVGQHTPPAPASPRATELCASALAAPMTSCHPHECHGHCTQNTLEAVIFAASGASLNR